MKYDDLLKELKLLNPKKILVTGPQRSGTRFTTNVIANDLNIKCLEEKHYSVLELSVLRNITRNCDSYAVQGPAISSMLDKLGIDDITIVFSRRKIEDIINSEKRINFNTSAQRRFYKRKYPDYYDDNKPISEIKYLTWDNYQKKALPYKCFDVEYDSLEHHPMFIKKEFRKHFTAMQIK